MVRNSNGWRFDPLILIEACRRCSQALGVRLPWSMTKPQRRADIELVAAAPETPGGTHIGELRVRQSSQPVPTPGARGTRRTLHRQRHAAPAAPRDLRGRGPARAAGTRRDHRDQRDRGTLLRCWSSCGKSLGGSHQRASADCHLSGQCDHRPRYGGGSGLLASRSSRGVDATTAAGSLGVGRPPGREKVRRPRASVPGQGLLNWSPLGPRRRRGVLVGSASPRAPRALRLPSTPLAGRSTFGGPVRNRSHPRGWTQRRRRVVLRRTAVPRCGGG